jgi:hypothetical protein
VAPPKCALSISSGSRTFFAAVTHPVSALFSIKKPREDLSSGGEDVRGKVRKSAEEWGKAGWRGGASLWQSPKTCSAADGYSCCWPPTEVLIVQIENCTCTRPTDRYGCESTVRLSNAQYGRWKTPPHNPLTPKMLYFPDRQSMCFISEILIKRDCETDRPAGCG